ncbi:MAG TPA: 3-isopropylmalate dehydrogenase [Candidatus Mediterraneibacter faecigallinarum]|uniref:3-isopropylmalate dehydrogenase n=1 Tax=Candidatus Mediterraneibacter faecigallinarum TaxID=2838669 RepID=A0A9D2NYC8_9FIRM|nr:3-isopropylmalate dehydrogenase [Candidatus Mediterraneibacter faecigallinarum]
MKYLEMHEEHLLSKKPLQMDILIVKKLRDIKIKKTIGRMFRKHNIIEYKSPEDSLSVNDFYKVYGYACIYQSNTDRVKEIDPEELTLTFACSHYPRKLLRHLETVRGMRAEYQGGGIYYLKGDPIPMQLLITPKLTYKENYWLQSMRTDLQAGEEIRKLVREYEKHRKSKDHAAVMDLITRANWKQMEVEKKMCDALKELFAEELKEADSRGRTEGIEQGIVRGKREMILAFLKAGAGIDIIKEASGLNEEQIEAIRREMN